MTLEFSERIARIPVYPAAGGYAQQEPLVRLASNESPYPPLRSGARGDRARAGHAQPLSRPDQLDPPRPPVRPLRRARRADRDRQRLLRHPARRRRGAARARRRARLRVAVVLGLPAPLRRLRRARDDRPARRRRAPRPAGDAARDHGRHAPGRSSATRTTRPRPRCRSRRSPRSSTRSPRTCA